VEVKVTDPRRRTDSEPSVIPVSIRVVPGTSGGISRMNERAPERRSRPGVSCRIRHTATVAGVSPLADSFVSGTTLSAASVASVACEPTVASADPVEVPLLRVRAAARGAFEEALSTDDAVAAYDLLAALDEEWLYCVEWSLKVRPTIRMIAGDQRLL
jgi:hypothetical protein